MKLNCTPSTIMSARAQVESLLALIKESAFKALDEYEKYGKDTPTLESLQAHPLDEEVNKLEFKKIVRTLEAACDQLCSTLAPPTHSVMKVRKSITKGLAKLISLLIRDRKTLDGLV